MTQTEARRTGEKEGRWRILALAGSAVVLVGIAAVGLYLRYGGGEGGGDRKTCEANLQTIGQACVRYADSHQGSLPPSLEVLLQAAGSEPLKPEQLTCPNAEKKGRGGKYVYVPGHRKTDDRNSIIAYEPMGNHKKKPGGHVLFLSGTVSWLDAKQHDAAVTPLKARQKAASPGAR